MKISNHSAVPVYTISGSNMARPLPEWLVRKRKRSLKHDPDFANRVELLQDFAFDEASACVRVSDDGDWLMSTGTYKPQMHVHYLPHLSLSFARHTSSLNQTFVLLASDYSKSLHLQADRRIEFHTAAGLHHAVRVPRYGRDVVYDRTSAEALVPSVGVNADGAGEVFRINLELGQFMKGYEVDVAGGAGGGLQGGVAAGSVNTASIAEESHNMLSFGTSQGTVEFWDARAKSRVGILSTPQDSVFEGHSEVTALQFHRSGLELAVGTSNGLIYLYDVRSPVPLLKKDQGYGFPIKRIMYLNTGTSRRAQTAEPKILSADKRIIKLWEPRTGAPWTSVEPAVDLNHVEWCRDSGMLLTANEGTQQHAFFIPQLGPAPPWCAFLDNIVEEMAENADDPNAFGKGAAGEVYDNYKFLTTQQLRQLNLDHLVGTTSLLRPYMHGHFVDQRLYEEARLISNPDLWQQQRAQSVQERIEKERESRIRGSKKVAVKVNRRLAEKMLEREEKNQRRKARRMLKRGGEEAADAEPDAVDANTEQPPESAAARADVLHDPRFARLFQDEDFEVDETSLEFQALNPSTARLPKGLTAVEQEEAEPQPASDSDASSASEGEAVRQPQAARDEVLEQDKNRISSSSYKKSRRRPPQQPQMRTSSQHRSATQLRQAQSFGARVAALKDRPGPVTKTSSTVVGERQLTFAPEKKRRGGQAAQGQGQRHDRNGQRSASGNVMRKL